ncbi:50S ribosomal protein L25 [bacterium]|nr:50S ribosomal protein L25 [bacterium]MBT01609.1 50S ribosomal protein L25 [bacterium]|tara:strand:+ start:424 stop:963 length:540 start_codon:yes stop_codon:yes gene_type:complete
MSNVLAINSRKESGKSALRKMRREGFVPGVLYGKGAEPVAFEADKKKVMAALKKVYKSNQVIEVELDGKKKGTAVFNEIQNHYFDGTLQHVDLWTVKPEEQITKKVFLVPSGEWDLQRSKGFYMEVKAIKITGPAGKMPGTIPFSTTGLEEGDKLRIKDLKIPDGIEIAQHGNTVICRQ